MSGAEVLVEGCPLSFPAVTVQLGHVFAAQDIERLQPVFGILDPLLLRNKQEIREFNAAPQATVLLLGRWPGDSEDSHPEVRAVVERTSAKPTWSMVAEGTQESENIRLQHKVLGQTTAGLSKVCFAWFTTRKVFRNEELFLISNPSEPHTAATRLDLQPVEAPPVLPVVFLADVTHVGNTGDVKPLLILCIWAAKYSPRPVSLVLSRELKSGFFNKLASFAIGDQWTEQLRVRVLPTSELREEVRRRSFVFGVDVVKPTSTNSVNLDFGDNEAREPCMRFATCLLSSFARQHSGPVPQYGGLYLPIGQTWSSEELVRTLREFRSRAHSRGQKVLCIAGSQVPPVALRTLQTWSQQAKRQWSMVLLGYAGAISEQMENRALQKWLNSSEDYLFVVRSYVEYEDAVKIADLYISNCGAGSVTAALAAGVPQVCGTFGSVGLDKKDNAGDLAKLGFPSRGKFEDVMRDVELKYESYLGKARRAAETLRREDAVMHQKLQQFFRDLQSTNLQQKIAHTRRIPAEYAVCLEQKDQPQKL